MSSATLTLYELTGMVRSVLEQTMDDEYWIETELSEAHVAGNGHFYVEFVQKDSSGRSLLAKARGTMWARTYQMLAPLFERATGERLRAGLQVRVLVTVAFHELYGFSLNIINIDPDYTLGDMARRRREILAQLETDGILNDNKQLPLPISLKRIAVISSPSAAGYGDFCNQLNNNAEGLYFEMRLFPAIMQGNGVEESVMKALMAVCDEEDQWDCVVIIRGGGATSDLSDFDTYTLAAAVAQMPIPVIVGIGHERDETVLDFVAHTRVKTPTAAAVFLIEHQTSLLARLDELSHTLTQQAIVKLQTYDYRLQQITSLLPRAFSMVRERQHHRLEQLAVRLASVPQQRTQTESHRQELIRKQLAHVCAYRLQATILKLDGMEQRLKALDPTMPLRRGYSLTFTSDGRLVKGIADITANDVLTTQLSDGTIQSKVISKGSS